MNRIHERSGSGATTAAAHRRLTRRTFLSSTLAAGASAAVAACGSGSGSGGGSGGTITLQFWNLFSGGDGARMTQLVNGFNKSQKDIQVKATTLTWGTPYYTKLTTSTVAGQAPDVAIMHLSRMASFAPTGIITQIDSGLMTKHGLSASQFSPRPWQMAHSGGQLMAIPLDTHPMVMYCNTDIARKAGLLGSDGLLKPVKGANDLISAFKSAASAGAKWGLSVDTEDVNGWRLWVALYSQLGGGSIVSPDGKDVLVDDSKGIEAASFLRELSLVSKVTAPATDYNASVALFGDRKAGFFLNGEWEVTTFQTDGTPFSMTLFPQVYDNANTWSDSHSFVIPHQRSMDPDRLDAVMQFIAYVEKNAITWAKGGHIPAYLPTVQSQAYQTLEPQANYHTEADHVVYDPQVWYSGAAGQLETDGGAAFQSVFSGQLTPQKGYAQFKTALQKLAAQQPPQS
jgi:multiple sugar transport system substrate-binding protein